MIIWALPLALLLLIIVRCAGDDNENPDPPVVEKDVWITAPSNDAQYVSGDPCTVKIEVNHPDLISDLQLWVDDTLFADSISLETQQFKFETTGGRVGRIPIYLKWKDGAGKERRDTRTIAVFSDIVPETKEVKIVQTYPHNPKSYTQGLEFYKGRLYEGTGQKESSLLAEVDLKTGAHLRITKLDNSIFGEGITILNDTIYQISYQAGKCFLWDVNSFEKITEFNYAGEGWGLCNNGKSILMSNGSDEIVWRDPRTFQVTKTIHIFDNQSNVAQLNELALIEGDLYANIYMDSKIARIDTASGKVLGYINCAPLVNAQPDGVDVINGIAYNDGKIYLTGKWWPNLYEVSFE